jgi:hypothetical protein
MMISENVHVLWDEIPNAADFIDTLANLYDEDNREWLWDEFLDVQSGCKESYLLEYVEFSGEEIITILDSYDVPEEYAKVFLGERIEGELSYDQIYTILDRVDEKLYPQLRQYIKKLPFSKRMDLIDVFDIEL